MSASSGSLPPPTESPVNADAAVLVAAMEAASAAIYCLTASLEPVWTNASARSLGSSVAALPPVDGRHLVDVIAEVISSGRSETFSGMLGGEGPQATVMVRPIPVDGERGAMLVLESADTATDASLWQGEPDLVQQAQLSLLPPSLPLLPDLRLSGSYHRASSATAAGGDWYDAVPLGEGRVALVVGDAVGHGVPAAAAMGRLRGAMRSSTLQDPSPRRVLAALDALAVQMDDVEGASVFYGVLEAGSGRLVYTGAGHPAPLLVHPDGTTSFLAVVPRPPLGILPDSGAAVSEVVLEQGATLVLFSNGAVTGAGADPTEALDRLAEVAREALAVPGALEVAASAELATAIAEGMRRPQGWPDDVAVLVAHRRGTALQPFSVDLVAVPAALPGVRRRLGSWLGALGMGEQDSVGVMVAVGEACANAAEHAYRGGEPGPLVVAASVDVDGVVTVTVQDEGTWRPPDRDPGDRGRGLLIMRQLVDSVALEEDGGTIITLRLRLRRSAAEHDERGLGSAGALVTVERAGEVPVVSVRGVVDEGAADQMRIRMLEASRGGTGRIELDVTHVGLFSSAAVREVLGLARIGRDEGWRLVVHAPVGGVTRHVLEISGLADLVDLR